MVLLRMLAFRPAQTPEQAVRSSRGAAAPQPGPAEKTEPAQALAAQAPKPAAAEASPVPRSGAGVTQDWRQILEGLAISGMVRQLAANCVLLQQDGSTIRLGLDAGYRQLLNPKAEKRLQQALGEYFDASIRLEIEVSTNDSDETPAQADQREKDERQLKAEKSVEEDGFVRAMKETFNAEVVPGSVRPTAEDN